MVYVYNLGHGKCKHTEQNVNRNKYEILTRQNSRAPSENTIIAGVASQNPLVLEIPDIDQGPHSVS